MASRSKAVTPKQIVIHDKLLEALDEVDRPGDFCTSGDRPLVMPGLDVEQDGRRGLAADENASAKLIKLCRQAPYGKGTETVVDTDVRRVWELDPAKFQLTNPKWDDFVASIVDDVKEGAGAGRAKAGAAFVQVVSVRGRRLLPASS